MLNVKLITIILFTTLLSSCFYVKPGKIVKIERIKSFCVYEVDNGIWFYPNWKFVTDCEVYNIGDTIKLTK